MLADISPFTLLAMQVYMALSDTLPLDIINTELLVNANSRRFKISPFFIQLILGAGRPVAEHRIVTLVDVRAVTSSPMVMVTGSNELIDSFLPVEVFIRGLICSVYSKN